MRSPRFAFYWVAAACAVVFFAPLSGNSAEAVQASPASAGVAATPGKEVRFHCLEIAPFVRKRLDQYRADESWGMVPRGPQRFGGVPFQLMGKLEITGMGAARDGRFYPSRFSGIVAGRKARRLHVLHGTGYAAPEGAPVAELVLRYSDGSRHVIPLIYGVHTRNWYVEDEERKADLADPASAVVWTHKQGSLDLRLFKSSFPNPHPERKIKSVDVLSLMSRATPVIVAMTLEDDRSAAPPGTAPTAFDDSTCRRELKVRVVNAQSGAPVPGAAVRALVTDTNRTFGFGTNRTDARGEFILDYPAGQLLRLRLEARAPAFLASTLVLSNAEPANFPVECVVKLASGVRLGGVVREPSGKPIAGVRVGVCTVAQDEVGQAIETEADAVVTDKSGRWATWSVAGDAAALTFKLSHPAYRPAEFDLTASESPSENEVSRAALLRGKALLSLRPGLPVTGTVTDLAGKPIAGAHVWLRDSAEEPTILTNTADAKGRFRFGVMAEGQGILAVSAPGFAPQRIEVAFGEEAKPAAFKLDRATPLRGRVLDGSQKPVAGAAVTLEQWKDLPFPRWSAQTDAEGRFAWDSAPPVAATYSIAKEGYRPLSGVTLTAAGQETTLRLDQAGFITGRVVDAETKKPIASFTVIRGRSYSGDDVYWERQNAVTGLDGKFSLKEDRNYSERICLAIEARGYLPLATPPFSSSGWVTNDYELKKGEGPRGVVRLPDGQPAAGAQVALLTGDYTVLKDGELEARGSGGAFARADSEGRFTLPGAYAKMLIAVHKQGYAEIAPGSLAPGGALTLQPWGRIEGVMRNGRRPATNQAVMVSAARGGGALQLNYDFEQYRTETDAQGRFNIQRVPPGQRFLVRLVPMDRGQMWSHITPVDVKPGEPTPVVYGGNGRAVIGKVTSQDSSVEIAWQSGHRTLHTKMPTPPATARTREEIQAWNDSEEVKTARANYRYYAVRMQEDGTFRIEDVPPGQYTLSMQFQGPAGDSSSMGGRYVGSIAREVEVPAMPDGPVDQPLDLGALELSPMR